MKLLTIILVIASMFSVAGGQSEIEFDGEVSRSALTQTALPAVTYHVRERNVPAQYRQLLKMYIDSNPLFSQGKIELLVLTGGATKKNDLGMLRAQVETNLKSDGWAYEVLGEEQGVTLFTAVKKTPAQTNIFGYWVPEKDGLMLAMEEVLVSGQGTQTTNKSAVSNPKHTNNASSGAETFELSADETFVNVMGNQMPALPNFSALTKKPGKVRGYAKDVSGKPLAGAYISASVTALAGLYSSVHGETDANGYYELDLPKGAGYFSSAAYAFDYGDGRIAAGLHPADGKIASFSSAAGEVENFVLMPYGIANRNGASGNPTDLKNYYGGTVRFIYTIRSDELTLNTLPENAEFEITLTPDGEMLGGTNAKTIIIRGKAELNGRNAFFVVNIPVGRYKISARLTNGKPLRMNYTSEYKPAAFGLHPRENALKGTLLFSATADPIGIEPAYGNWSDVSVQLFLP